MTPPRPEQPRTAAGRAHLARFWPEGTRLAFRLEEARDAILAIEREAAAPLSVAELAAALYNCDLYGDGYENHPAVTAWDDLSAAEHEGWTGDAAAILAELE